MMLTGVLIVWMHLHRQALGREEQLDEQRTDTATCLASQHGLRIGGDGVAECRAAGDGVLVDRKPRLADWRPRVFRQGTTEQVCGHPTGAL